MFDFIAMDRDTDNVRVDVLHLSPPCQYWSPALTVAGVNDEANIAILFSCHELACVFEERFKIWGTNGETIATKGIASCTSDYSFGDRYENKIINGGCTEHQGQKLGAVEGAKLIDQDAWPRTDPRKRFSPTKEAQHRQGGYESASSELSSPYDEGIAVAGPWRSVLTTDIAAVPIALMKLRRWDPRAREMKLDTSTMVVHFNRVSRKTRLYDQRIAWGVYLGPESDYNSNGRIHGDMPQISKLADIQALSKALDVIDAIRAIDEGLSQELRDIKLLPIRTPSL
ncbi:hypothetical protein F4778DRAFT_781625 [Xylariomycetidae sp. FL2044]|nr:hypothetical protein F4778DRAFT_781625 [Xylariomycetidae sp. FL2044]